MSVKTLSRLLLVLPMLLLLAAVPQTPGVDADSEERPFSFPFAGPPGPSTWLFGQSYGNTTFAFRSRFGDYRMGQGIHFGIDISAKCKTPVLAIYDGVVAVNDDVWYYGSGPHNIIINHPNGYASMYGHLFERSRLPVGTQVKRGQQVGLSGDPDETCYSRPHLHLEIRDLSHKRAYNPLNLIDVDWDAIALYNATGRSFQRNLDDPRQWQNPFDQPDTTFGGPVLNNFPKPWPP
jgi:murein DD-endopeptidase MepM/ murein hydrolase activator NlpD